MAIKFSDTKKTPHGTPIVWRDVSPKKGRPRLEHVADTFEASKPWLALGMSRRTWYRRKKEGKK